MWPLTADQVRQPQTSATVQRTGPPPFYALVVGINEYASLKVKDLKGAVPDALAVKKYLEEDLGVPEPQICLLHDAEATRGRIIKEFNNLLADQRIRRGDPILIYYAGHGGEVDAPKGWEASGGKIQMLIPYDFRTTVDGKNITGIPDITIGTLLSRISGKCGDNITIILDCCHSGSGTRVDPSDSSLMKRVTEIPNDLPSDLDIEIWGNAQHDSKRRGPAIASGFLHHGLRSHILLAACTEKEAAYERKGALHENKVNGVFTGALLKTLRKVGTPNVTYTALFQQLPSVTPQNPQCEGIHRNRTLFNAKKKGLVPFQVRQDGDNYVTNVGTAAGIDIGDEVTLYKDYPQQSSPLGTLVVLKPRLFHSIMAPPPSASRFRLQKPAFALLTKVGTKQVLRLYVARHKHLTSTFEEFLLKMQDERPGSPRILEVEKENAKLGIHPDGEKVVFEILDNRVTGFNLRRIPFSVQPDAATLYPIFDAAAYFHWHLDRTDEYHDLQDKVHLEFTKVQQVERKFDKDLNPVIEPIGDNMNQNGVISLVGNDKVMYGIKIVNETNEPLYPALFYFDNSNLSITSLYQPPFAGQFKVHAPLQPKGSITLGYGAGGEIPYTYRLDKSQDVEVGFLKLYLSTEYVDLSDVEQPTPFTDDPNRPIGRGEELLTRLSTWDTILVTVVIRKE